MWSVIFSPLSYLRIIYPQKWVVDWLYPGIAALLSLWLVLKFGAADSISGPQGIIDRLILVASIMPGFFVAALAAIATFNRPDIDDLMPEPAPTLLVEMQGQENTIQLTRRRFLAFLFAFLCWESLALLVVCVFSSAVGSTFISMAGNYGFVVKSLGLFVLLAIFWQLMFATCLGLYYLGDRLNRPTY